MSGRAAFVRACMVVAVAGLVVALAPGSASAHAILVSSSPPAGARLGTAPGIVVLRFSEPLNPELSGVSVTDPAGAHFAGTASGTTIEAPLTTNVPGGYVVAWKSVSADDGHTEAGQYRFTVVAAGVPGSPMSTATGPGRADLIVGAFRLLQFLALLFAMGTLLVVRLARREPPIRWVRSRLRAALAVALASGVIVVVSDAIRASPTLSFADAWGFLTTGLPGIARLALVAAEAFALAAVSLNAPVLPSLLTALVALAASGHAAGVRPAWWGITVDAGHLVTAGLWAGGIVTLATLRPPGGWRGRDARRLLDRFSPVAVSAFLATVGLGVVQGFQDVGSISALFGSSYGRVLLVKTGLVVAMVPLSLLAWRRRLAPRAEAGLAVLVIGAAALLSAYPIPASRLPPVSAAPGGANALTLGASAFPHAGDLTLGSHAGSVLLGLTLAPGKPGPNQLTVYVLPLQGSAAAVPLTLSVNGRSLPVRTCGPTCRTAGTDLAGGERVTVGTGASNGGMATFDLPSLPAPDGSSLLQQAQLRMHQLRTYRLTEVLSSGLGTVRSTYEFEAPNRMSIDVGSGAQQVLIGGVRYIRQAPNDPWTTQRGGPPVPVPSFIWDYFKPLIDARVVGSASVDGVQTTVVAFFGHAGDTGVWFRLWIDPSGLVRQAQMRANGHFMDHTYFDFGAPLTITPPAGARG